MKLILAFLFSFSALAQSPTPSPTPDLGPSGAWVAISKPQVSRFNGSFTKRKYCEDHEGVACVDTQNCPQDECSWIDNTLKKDPVKVAAKKAAADAEKAKADRFKALKDKLHEPIGLTAAEQTEMLRLQFPK